MAWQPELERKYRDVDATRSQYFELLPEWFAHLDEEGFDVSIVRQGNAGHWLLMKLQQPDFDARDQRQWLADLSALLCRNESEQAKYARLLANWSRLQKQTSPSTETKSTTSVTEVKKPLRGGRLANWWIAAALVAGFLGLIAIAASSDFCNALGWSGLCEWIHPTGEVTDETPESVQQLTDATLPPVSGWTPVAVPLPTLVPGLLVEDLSEPAARHWLWWALAWLPVLLTSAWLAWYRTRRRDVLEHSKTDDLDKHQRDALRLSARHLLFDNEASDHALRALNRKVTVSDARGIYDVQASCEQTVRSGRLTHQYRPLQRLPEVLLLVQVGGGSDLRGELAERLTTRIRDNGLRVSAYLFTSSTNWLIPLETTQRHGLNKEQLRQRHPTARLLLLTEPARVVDLYGSNLLDWAQSLVDWQDPLPVLTLEPFDLQLAGQLREQGLQLLPLTTGGLQQLAGAGSLPESAPPSLPLALQNALWPEDLQTRTERISQLQSFLGHDGMVLLSALALYPELHLGLAAALDQQLFPAANFTERQARLLTLLRLPWARHGWLPDTLRMQLVDAMTLRQRAKAEQCYRELFKSLADSGELQLPFSHPDGWSSLRLFLGARGVGEHDVVFLSMVAGPAWLRQLSFLVPSLGRGLARLGTHHAACAAALLLVSAMPLGYLLEWLPFKPPSNVGEPVPLEISLFNDVASQPRANTIAEWLTRSGAQVTRPVGSSPEAGIKLVTTPQRDPQARRLAEHLRRMPDPQLVQIELDGTDPKQIEIQVGASLENPIRVYRDVVTETSDSTTVVLPQMIMVPAGSFLMGSPDDEPERVSDEGPQRLVQIQAFELAVNEVTFDEYDLFVQATNRTPPEDEGWGRGARPVINVSWNDAMEYIAWLNTQSGGNYRLPSEAEWEYAARAGTTSAFFSGDCINTEQANYDGSVDYNGCGADSGLYREQTVPVTELAGAVNQFGLRHMAGNVWEWTQDCWHSDYTDAPDDGTAWLEGEGGNCDRRVLRGGGWFDRPEGLRSAYRIDFGRSVALSLVGFRLARTPVPAPSAR